MSLNDTHKKLQQGQGFASLKLVDDFLLTGALPKIHDDMGKVMTDVPPFRRHGALDLGACHGLLSIRARYLGWTPVIGWEADQATVDVFDQHVAPKVHGVEMEAARLDVRTPLFHDTLVHRCRSSKINTILARRAFPELFSDTYGKAGLEDSVWRNAGAAFSYAAQDAGIEFIALEGRQHAGRKNLANPLYRVEREIEALGDRWAVRSRYKECVLLEIVR